MSEASTSVDANEVSQRFYCKMCDIRCYTHIGSEADYRYTNSLLQSYDASSVVHMEDVAEHLTPVDCDDIEHMIKVTRKDLVNEAYNCIKKLLDEMKKDGTNRDLTKLSMLINRYYNREVAVEDDLRQELRSFENSKGRKYVVLEVKLLINEIVYQFYRVRQIFERLSNIDADQLDDILNGMVYEKLCAMNRQFYHALHIQN